MSRRSLVASVVAVAGCARDEAPARDAGRADRVGASDAVAATDAGGCPATLPGLGTACALAAGRACVYGATGCNGGTPGRRRCVCADGGWACACLTGP